MNEISRRRCGNCCSFNVVSGFACSNGVSFIDPDGALIAATASDICDEHLTDQEAEALWYERAEHHAEFGEINGDAPNALPIGGGAQAW
jgi:hypothetical protein